MTVVQSNPRCSHRAESFREVHLSSRGNYTAQTCTDSPANEIVDHQSGSIEGY